MIDYSKQFNDIMAQIQAQYKGSNVAQLIEGIIEIKKKGVLRAYKSLIDDCLNLSTAKGDALDLWGYILGINRFVPRDSNQDAKENFKQWNFNKSNFKHLIFLQVRDHLYHRLADDDFRNLLLLFLQRQYIFASPREAQSLIDDYISKKYGELNIWDSQKMSIVAEFSFRDYPDWMRWYILLKDIIPRPAGVKVNIIDINGAPNSRASTWNAKRRGAPMGIQAQLSFDDNPDWEHLYNQLKDIIPHLEGINVDIDKINNLDSKNINATGEFSFNDYPNLEQWHTLLKDIIPNLPGVKVDITDDQGDHYGFEANKTYNKVYNEKQEDN